MDYRFRLISILRRKFVAFRMRITKDGSFFYSIRIALVATFLLYLAAFPLQARLKNAYLSEFSSIISDRNGAEIEIQPNERGFYSRQLTTLPDSFRTHLIEKEDRFFYLHNGINPLSIIRDLFYHILFARFEGSSTITQQLVKNLLGNENSRNFKNKFIEGLYALTVELYTPKSEILKMYADTAYFGKQAKGLEEASLYYYNIPPESLSESQILALLATLNNPASRLPGTKENNDYVKSIAEKENILLTDVSLPQKSYYSRKSNVSFELDSLNIPCSLNCKITIDEELTSKLRSLLEYRLRSLSIEGVKNGAIVVIKLSSSSPSNELLAVVGSPNPSLPSNGQQINMAIEPRPIGSTAKPFFYAKAFEKGARPYTLVDDREYKYTIGTGFEFYPKNYDGQYRGIVTLHEALSNSLNVPSVKTLEFVGVNDFNSFLENTLKFHSVQPLDTYQLGIALGGLEMDLLTLSNYYTIFPNEGVLKPLRIAESGTAHYLKPPMADSIEIPERILDPSYTRLVTKIISDRDTSVDQFGIKSNLNLTETNYAVKTGTTYNYHDSWTMGYTPDFLVGVWLGNSDNTPVKQVSGQIGAGKVWHDAMELMLASPYNLHTAFNFSGLEAFNASDTIDYGLKNDNFENARNIMSEHALILEPHMQDVFLFEQGMTIPLTARENVGWFVNGLRIAEGKNASWQPKESGTYEISALAPSGRKESVEIVISSSVNRFNP